MPDCAHGACFRRAGAEDYLCPSHRAITDGAPKKVFEIPLIIEVEGYTREDACNEASDLADSIADTFETGCVAIISENPDLLDRMGIDREGHTR